MSPVAYTDYGLRGPNVPLKMETFSGTKTILWHAKLFILLLLNISFVVCQSGYFVQNCIYYCTRFIPLREVCYFLPQNTQNYVWRLGSAGPVGELSTVSQTPSWINGRAGRGYEGGKGRGGIEFIHCKMLRTPLCVPSCCFVKKLHCIF